MDARAWEGRVRAWEGRVRAFRSRAEISIKQRDDNQKQIGGFLYTQAAGIIKIRSTIGDAKPDFLQKPYPVKDMVADFEGLLFKSMKTLHIPGEYLLLLAEDLIHQLILISTKFFGRDPHHSYVIFIDIKIKMKGEELKYTPNDHYLENLTGEMAEEILGTCPGIYVLRKSSRMNEVKAVVKTHVFDRRDDLDLQIDCPICLREMHLGDIYVKTPCKHAFHTGCLGQWLASTYKPAWMSDRSDKILFPICPMCRQYLLA